MQMLYRVRTTFDSKISLFVEPCETNYATDREAIKEMIRKRDRALTNIGMELLRVHADLLVDVDGLERYYWRVVEDDYFELFCDNAVEVFRGRNEFTATLEEMIQKRGAILHYLPSSKEDEEDDIQGIGFLQCLRAASKREDIQQLVDQWDVTNDQFEGLRRLRQIGQSTEEDKAKSQKHVSWAFYGMVPVPPGSPLSAMAAQFLSKFKDHQQQKKFEGLLLNSPARYQRDKHLEIREDDTSPNQERETIQYQVLEKLCISWGLEVFMEDGSATLDSLFDATSHSSIELFEEHGGDVQRVLYQNTYQTLVFPKSVLQGIKASYEKNKIVHTLTALTNSILGIFGLTLEAVKESPRKVTCQSLEGMNGPLLKSAFDDLEDNSPPSKRNNMRWRFKREELADRLVLLAHRLRSVRPMRNHSITANAIEQWLEANVPVLLCTPVLLACSDIQPPGLSVSICSTSSAGQPSARTAVFP
jgi:hypothetical protein